MFRINLNLRWLYIGLLSVILVACNKEDVPEVKQVADKTILMYFPWSGPSNDLTSFFRGNIADMEKAMAHVGKINERVLVYLASSGTDAELFELKYDEETNTCKRLPLKTYTSPRYTSVDWMRSLFVEVKTLAPADTYAMTMGCHGNGWMPTTVSKALFSQKFDIRPGIKPVLQTRFFGGSSEAYQTNVTDLAEALTQADLKMEFILMDLCYMATIEVAYDLRHVTDYFIASTCEIMGDGMPFEKVGIHLFGQPDYEAICDDFYSYYTNSSAPFATLSVTKTSELGALASVMKEINQQYTFNETNRYKLQILDGYRQAIYYDMGNYVEQLCNDNNLLHRFELQMDLAIPYKIHTDAFYSSLNGGGVYSIHSFSGLTISDPSLSTRVKPYISTTNWYKDSH